VDIPIHTQSTFSFDFDFYLQAHAGLQGTVRPTHYTVVYDENALGANELQQGTNDVSYLYARATKAVSLIPAAYYADLACERGRCYLNDFLVDDKTSSSGKGKVERDEEKQRVFTAAKAYWGEGVSRNLRAISSVTDFRFLSFILIFEIACFIFKLDVVFTFPGQLNVREERATT